MPYTTLKMAVLAPMPTASVMIAASANDLLWVSSRNPCRASCRKCSSQVIVHSSRAPTSERIQAAIALPLKRARIVPQATSSNQLKNANLGLAPDSKVFVCAPHCRAIAQSRRTSPLRSGPNPALTRSARRRLIKLVFHFCFLSDETGTSESNGGVHGAFSGGGNSATGEPAAFCGFVRGAFPAPRVAPGGLAGAQARAGEFSQSLRRSSPARSAHVRDRPHSNHR